LNAFIAAIALTVVAFGSVAEIPLNLAAIGFAILNLFSLSRPIAAAVRRVWSRSDPVADGAAHLRKAGVATSAILLRPIDKST
jgi:hypothetical protein